MKKGKEDRKERAIIEELRLMEKMMKAHQWVAVGQEEAEKEEKAEKRLEAEAEASPPAADKGKGGGHGKQKDNK